MKSDVDRSESFMVKFDYFGLSSSAIVDYVNQEDTTFFRCKLPTLSATIDIAFTSNHDMPVWIDLKKGEPSVLAQLVGEAIENKMGMVRP